MGNLPSCSMPNLTRFFEAKTASHEIDADDYQQVREVNDPRFGTLHLMKSKSRDHMLCIKEMELNYSVAQLDEIKFRSRLSNPYLLETYGFRRANAENRIQIYFETFDGDLEKDIQQAVSEKNAFSEEKLNIILHCTLNALSYLQENNVAHENITPVNILRIGESYKLYENSIIAGSSVLYHQAFKGSNSRYLAPELLGHLARNDAYPNHYAFKADIYALGVCILDAGVLEFRALALVDRKKLEVIPENLQACLKRFKELYSPQLCKVIEEMLSQDPQQRPDAITLYNRLPAGARDGKKRVFTSAMDSPKQISSPRSKFSNVGRLEALKQNQVSVVHYLGPKQPEDAKTENKVPLSYRIGKPLLPVEKVVVRNAEGNTRKTKSSR